MPVTSFIDVLNSRFSEDDYFHPGSHGNGLPKNDLRNFMFATGIECSYPTIGHGKTRRDLLEECGHYKYWKEDLHLVKELGLNVLRYGLPYHSIHQAYDRFDWSFADEVMHEMRRLDIVPILDLMHFGVPDWIQNFQNPELSYHFCRYASAVAERYPWVRFYTPVNEIYITARGSAKDGIWNEQRKDDHSFVTALKNIVAASIMATHRVLKHRPDAVIVQSETAEYLHEASVTKSKEVALSNKLRFLALDLLYSYPPDSDVCMYLLDNGLSRKELDWFMSHEAPGYQVMGNDYYGRNERIILPDGSYCGGEDVYGWYYITKDYYDRYHKPVMQTETNVFNADDAPAWLWKQWMNVLSMRKQGVPVCGFTWYSLTDQIDWDIALAEKNGNINECGLYDLNRKPRPVADAYKMLLKEFGQITIYPHGELLSITELPATVKVEI
jgi:beta-glucosidase/6-phospho-beta-glucosidase/beta-galactosidase